MSTNDPVLRRQTGSYYTPVEAADPTVRLVDVLLRTRLGHANGFASSGGVAAGRFEAGVAEEIGDDHEVRR